MSGTALGAVTGSDRRRVQSSSAFVSSSDVTSARLRRILPGQRGVNTIELIYRKYATDVFRFARWLSGDVTEAEDIVSETFLRLWGSTDDLRVATVKAYLLTIARNVFVSRRRRSARLRELPAGMLDHAPRPEVAAEHRDDLRAAMDAVQSLPEGERVAFLMRIQQELPYEEIARSLGISLSAAKVRVHRARVKLAGLKSMIGGPS